MKKNSIEQLLKELKSQNENISYSIEQYKKEIKKLNIEIEEKEKFIEIIENNLD